MLPAAALLRRHPISVELSGNRSVGLASTPQIENLADDVEFLGDGDHAALVAVGSDPKGGWLVGWSCSRL